MKQGFSLLEILMALAVMLVGIVGIMALFPVGLRASKVGENYTLAAILAQRVMEEAKLTPFASLADISETAFSSPDDNFKWSLDVEDDAKLPSILKKITVTIKWSDLGGTRQEDFVTYRANY